MKNRYFLLTTCLIVLAYGYTMFFGLTHSTVSASFTEREPVQTEVLEEQEEASYPHLTYFSDIFNQLYNTLTGVGRLVKG